MNIQLKLLFIVFCTLNSHTLITAEKEPTPTPPLPTSSSSAQTTNLAPKVPGCCACCCCASCAGCCLCCYHTCCRWGDSCPCKCLPNCCYTFPSTTSDSDTFQEKHDIYKMNITTAALQTYPQPQVMNNK